MCRLERKAMKFVRRLMVGTVVAGLLVTVTVLGNPQQVSRQSPRDYRMSDAQMRNLLNSIEMKTDRFSADIPRALDNSSLDTTNREDRINDLVTNFEYATDQLTSKFNNRNLNRSDVEDVLQRALRIDRTMRRRQFASAVETEWRSLRYDLNGLARAYDINWNWNQSNIKTLTGTYRIDSLRSEDPKTVANRTLRDSSLPSDARNRIYGNLTRRLEAPTMLAIQTQSNDVILATSRSPRVTLQLSGRQYIERYPDGRSSHVSASIQNDQLRIVSNGNRANDFTATFEPIDNGRRLRVSRQIYVDRLNAPVTVTSYYDQVSDVPQFSMVTTDKNDRRRGFLVTDNTKIVAVLNTDLDTNTDHDYDRFTLTVVEPAQYRNAVIEGYLTNVDRSGRLAGRANVTLNFDRIRYNGHSYDFAGVLENIQTQNGEDVRVDNEGAIAEEDSQTKSTVERTAIGSAVGALIGAIAGGGKGAAIGAAVGAGAGAGSVYIQGHDDLELNKGSRITIRATGPRG
jgi:hypothetical protein